MMRRFAPLFVTFIPVTMPALSPSMETGTLEKWNVKVGDKVDPGMSFCSIQTDKASVSFDNAIDEGFFAKVFAKEGDIVKVGGIIGLMVEDNADVGKANEYKIPAELTGGSAAADATPAKIDAAPSKPASISGGNEFSSAELEAAIAKSGPAVERIARECGIDQFKNISTTGKGDRFTKGDVVDLKPSAKAPAAAPPKAPAGNAAAASAGGNVWCIATKPSAVFDFKFKDDAVLMKLCSSMPIVPIPKPKEVLKEASADVGKSKK